MKSTLEDLKNRRSCRAYRPEQIKAEELEAVLEAGVYAPNGRGHQSAVLVAVQDKDTRDQLSRMNAAIMGKEGDDPFYGAPTVIVVLAEADWPTAVYDGSCTMCNLLNAASAIGLGSCWIHRAKEEFESEEGKALLKQWGIEGSYIGVGHCVLGYPAQPLDPAEPRKEGGIVRVL